jgi:hypothetical protein
MNFWPLALLILVPLPVLAYGWLGKYLGRW